MAAVLVVNWLALLTGAAFLVLLVWVIPRLIVDRILSLPRAIRERRALKERSYFANLPPTKQRDFAAKQGAVKQRRRDWSWRAALLPPIALVVAAIALTVVDSEHTKKRSEHRTRQPGYRLSDTPVTTNAPTETDASGGVHSPVDDSATQQGINEMRLCNEANTDEEKAQAQQLTSRVCP